MNKQKIKKEQKKEDDNMVDVIGIAGTATGTIATGSFGTVAGIVILVTVIIAGLIISSRIRNNGLMDKWIQIISQECLNTRQLHIYKLTWIKKQKFKKINPTAKVNVESRTEEESIESIGFQALPKEIEEKLAIKRPIDLTGSKVTFEGLTTLKVKQYLECLGNFQDSLYDRQIANWWAIVKAAVSGLLIVLLMLSLYVDGGEIGIATYLFIGSLIVLAAVYFYSCANNKYEVKPNEKGSKRFRGIGVGDVGPGKYWLWLGLETIVTEPSTDHPIRIEFEDVPIPIENNPVKEGERPEDKEFFPNIDLTISTLWRYANLTKAFPRIGTGTTASANIETFLKGQLKALINSYFAEVDGSLLEIMRVCSFVGEDLDALVQDLIASFWFIDVDSMNVEPDTTKVITDARNDRAKSVINIGTARNEAEVALVKLRVGIKYLKEIKGDEDLNIDENTMKAIVVATVLEKQIMAVGSKINLAVADQGLLNAVFSLLGKTTTVPVGKDLEKAVQVMNDPDIVKKFNQMYDAFMNLKEK